MTERSVRAILDELNELLDSDEDVGLADRDALRDAATSILDALGREDSDADELSSLRQRIERFESSHPRLTETVRRLVDQLSEMGI